MTRPRSMNLPPTPLIVQGELEFIRERLLDPIMDEYRWAYNLGYDRRQRGDVQTRSTGHADPTQGIVVSQGGVRKATHQAAEKIRKARSLLQAAQDDLAKAHHRNDADHIMEEEHTPSAFHDRRPVMISKRELYDAQDAQKRRQGRGEGWGVA